MTKPAVARAALSDCAGWFRAYPGAGPGYDSALAAIVVVVVVVVVVIKRCTFR